MHWPQNYLIKTTENKKREKRKHKRQNDVYRDLFWTKKNCTKLKMKLGIHAANEISLRHCLIHSFRWRDLFVLRFMIIIVVLGRNRSRSCCCRCCCCCVHCAVLNLCFMFEQSSKTEAKMMKKKRTLSLFATPTTSRAPWPLPRYMLPHSLTLSLSPIAFSNCQRQAMEHKASTPQQPLQVDRGEKKVNLISSVCNNCPSPCASLRLSFSAVSQHHVNKPSASHNPCPRFRPRARPEAGAARLLCSALLWSMFRL